MHRTYTLELSRDDRAGGVLEGQLFRVGGDGGLELVASVDRSYAAFGVSGTFERLSDQLIVYE